MQLLSSQGRIAQRFSLWVSSRYPDPWKSPAKSKPSWAEVPENTSQQRDVLCRVWEDRVSVILLWTPRAGDGGLFSQCNPAQAEIAVELVCWTTERWFHNCTNHISVKRDTKRESGAGNICSSLLPYWTVDVTRFSLDAVSDCCFYTKYIDN